MTQEAYEPEYHLNEMTASGLPVITEEDIEEFNISMRNGINSFNKLRKGKKEDRGYSGLETQLIINLLEENPGVLGGLGDAIMAAGAQGRIYDPESARFGALIAYSMIESACLRRGADTSDAEGSAERKPSVSPQIHQEYDDRMAAIIDSANLVRGKIEEEYGPAALKEISYLLGRLETLGIEALSEARTRAERHKISEERITRLEGELNDNLRRRIEEQESRKRDDGHQGVISWKNPESE